MPSTLKTLEINFSGGKNCITDKGLIYLTDKLPLTLNSLSINFNGGRNNITDTGSNHLSVKLPSNLALKTL